MNTVTLPSTIMKVKTTSLRPVTIIDQGREEHATLIHLSPPPPRRRDGKVAQPRVLRAGGSPHAASLLGEVAGRQCERGGEAGETSAATPPAPGDQRSAAGGEAAAGPGEAGQTHGCAGKRPPESFPVCPKSCFMMTTFFACTNIVMNYCSDWRGRAGLRCTVAPHDSDTF